MSTFDASLHPRGQAANHGQFINRTNDAPTGVLADPVESSTGSILKERANAASLHASARNTYLLANRDAATALLREQFPGVQMAIFTRNWDDDQVRLHQLLGTANIDFTESTDWAELSKEQRDAYRDAQAWVREMGDDIASYLEPSDEEHDGWYEYQIDLTTQPQHTDAAHYTLEQLERSERSALCAALSDMDGRAISTFDTDEIVYQLQEGYWAEADDLALADKLTARYGSIEKAADAIATSTEWGELREEVDRHAREQMIDHLARAATNLIWAEGAE